MPSIVNFRRLSCARLPAALLFVLAAGTGVARAEESGNRIAPKPLVDLGSPQAIKQLKPNYGDPEYTVDKTGISVGLPAARANFPGIQVIPAAE